MRAWGLLSVLMGLADVLTSLNSQIDLRPLSYTFVTLNDAGTVMFWLMAFAIGTGITVRELDDRTLLFLDGLPVSRTRVFLVKLAATITLVMLAPLVRFTSVILMHWLSRSSLDETLHIELLLQMFGIHALLLANGVCLGAALGRLRSLTWLAGALLLSGLLLLVRAYPRAMLLNPTMLLDARLSSTSLHIDWQTVSTQIAITAVALLIAWRGFLRAGKVRALQLPPRPLVGAVLTTVTVLAVSATLILMSLQYQPDYEGGVEAADDSQIPYFSPSPPASTATQHYRFSYPAHQADAALALAEQADQIFVRVHELLGAPLGAPIDVDASGSLRNTHGTAFFGRIRMVLEDDAVIVLAHETAHVVSQRIAGNHRDWLWRAAPVLNEGLATWVHAQFGSTDKTSPFVLAALHTRRELSIEELASPDRLGLLRDEEIQYPAGYALIAATVRVYGEGALPRLLRAFNDPQLPTDLEGLQLWQATFQLADMDLSAVIDEFYRQISSYAAEHADAIAALPRIRVRVVEFAGQYGIQPFVDGPQRETVQLALRFRPTPDSTYDLIDTRYTTHRQPVWRSFEEIASARICVQAGVEVDEAVLYEPWVCLPIVGAVTWEPEDQ